MNPHVRLLLELTMMVAALAGPAIIIGLAIWLVVAFLPR
jgi:hypothetical protein